MFGRTGCCRSGLPPRNKRPRNLARRSRLDLQQPGSPRLPGFARAARRRSRGVQASRSWPVSTDGSSVVVMVVVVVMIVTWWRWLLIELPMAAPPTPPTTAPTGPPTTAPPTAPATPPVTAPLSSASAAEEEAQMRVAAATASIHRDMKTSIGLAGSPMLFGAVRSVRWLNGLEGRKVPWRAYSN